MLCTWAPRLLQRVAHGDGSFSRRLAQLRRIDLLVIDDLAIAPITADDRNDLLELLDDQVHGRSTLITSPLPVSAWHEWLDDPKLADASGIASSTRPTSSQSSACRCTSNRICHEHPSNQRRAVHAGPVQTDPDQLSYNTPRMCARPSSTRAV